METTSKQNSNEAVYQKASMFKRFVAYFFDISLWLLTSLIFFTVINSIVNTTSWYKELDKSITEIRSDSKLYLNGVKITTYLDQVDSKKSIKEQNEFLTSNIDSFYSNSNFFSDDLHIVSYNKRKITASKDGVYLFKKVNNTIEENAVNPSYLNEFYRTEVEEYALAYLYNNVEYGNLSRTVFLKSVVEFVSSLTLFFIIYYLVLPLTCFKRGRQTIGMKIEKIALINSKAVNVPTKVYLLRFIFMLFIMVYLNFFSFLLPSFFSVGMMLTNKNSQTLPNYVFNDYFVDGSNQYIYLDEVERYLAKAKVENASIENTDFIIK